MSKKFTELFIEGKVTLNDIDDFIDEWHDSDSEELLFEFLGLTKEQYSMYVEGRMDNFNEAMSKLKGDKL